ncbi:phosphatase PAP2 family protein [Streptococcus sobrinus]|uniref:phosphatase PAP2 family protein n=1 Tax=Streptococcus sobrinus TaxID=1310 RepID=UPI0002F12F3C|nr:phosphatase PAP2 family protein [Streptococcus sobrinus]
MKDYAEFYERLTAPLRRHPWSIQLLKVTNGFLAKIMAVLYPMLLLYLLWQKRFTDLGLTIFITACAFLALSAFRRRLDYLRPYESWSIAPLIHKTAKGTSFPSRHVFSASMISLSLWQVSPVLAVFCLVLSVLLGFCRILGGMHYPKDVIVGYLLGLLASSFLLILL